MEYVKQEEFKIAKNIIINELKILIECNELLKQTGNSSLQRIVSEIKENKKEYIQSLLKLAEQADMHFDPEELKLISDINGLFPKKQNEFTPLY
ncbi:MAG: hypothetical protein M1331_01680 [Candidatus Marsarchaeota archaeon]|nr:hypothetical protein [Candidatus Marsarchaeota archaeon]MCL5106090.1 hypothetical protein [Candidatus Marsarchaeota archaeon]